MKTTNHTTREAVAASDRKAPPARLTWIRTITETVELERDAADAAGQTIGERIDNLIRVAIMEGQTVQTVTLEIEPETWQQIAEDFATFGHSTR